MPKQVVKVPPSSTEVTVEISLPDSVAVAQSGGTPIPTPPVNQAPTANAGPDSSITLPTSSTTLSGTATDPDGTIATYVWSRVSGPSNVTFGTPNAATTTVNGLVQGTYVFRFAVTDNNGATGVDDKILTVNPAVNKAPTANAGADVTITSPTSTASLKGSGSDPDGDPITYAWTKISGTGGTIVSPKAAVTDVTGLSVGSYVFRLTVTDSQSASASDDVAVVVNSSTPPPNPGPLPAIEGYGSQAQGANTSKVYRVTNLNANGQGSLNYILSETNPTGYTIVFDVAGTISQSHRVYTGSNFTIAGETAPFPGITIATNGGDGLVMEGSNVHHIIVRGITTKNCSNDGIAINDGAHDITISNCTSYGNHDGNIDISSDSHHNTIQWCINGNNQAFADGNSGGSLLTGRYNSFHHNLCYPLPQTLTGQDGERFPYVHHNYGLKAVPPEPDADIRNNLVWKWGRNNGTGSGFGSKIVYAATGNIVNNYYYTTGPSVSDGVTLDSGEPQGYAYIAGNVSGNNYNYNAKSNKPEYTIPSQYKITMTDACTAAKQVLATAGIPQRDANGARRSDEQAYVNGIVPPGC